MSDLPPADPSSIPPLDDGGAVAGDGLGFQYDCIARLVIAMLVDGTVEAIVCETHEDAVVAYADGSFELVSCKARDPGRPYTVTTLVSDGGLRHLFDSWMRTGQHCRAHLMTEASCVPEARRLVDDCESRDCERIRPWGERLATLLDADAATAARFLTGFRTTDPRALGSRAHAGGINAMRLRPWLRERRLNQALERPCYALLRDLAATSCRAAVADPMPAATLLEASRHPADARLKDRLAGRRITRERAEACVLDVTTGQPLLTGDPSSLDHTRMAAKLERGAVPPQVISAARRLRASWYEYEAALTIRAPGSDPGLTDVRTRVLLKIGDAIAGLDLTEPYGQRMYAALRDELTTSALGEMPVLGLSDELLLGLVFQATDECELFWSAPFDVDAELG